MATDRIAKAKKDRETLRTSISQAVSDFESQNAGFEIGHILVTHEYSRVVGAVVTRVEVEVQIA